ncbi:acylphosphatase [Mucilaginibacter terrae]|uniref:acylphosphatase n=1 Tax=Mucilaginibacter terrae TaxID=1955052 RepID=UPI003637D4C5
MIKHLNITVQGKVQGVSYRVTTKAVADQLGVRGFIRNEANGDVYIEAEAEQSLMELFMEWCEDGPDPARVTAVTTTEGEIKNYRNFEVVKK